MKIDLRVAEVLTAEAVEGADKLLKLRVRLGDEERDLVSGVRAFYSPEQMVGRKVVMVANLAPRKLRGVVSQGMILAAHGPDDRLTLIGPEGDVPSAAKVS